MFDYCGDRSHSSSTEGGGGDKLILFAAWQGEGCRFRMVHYLAGRNNGTGMWLFVSIVCHSLDIDPGRGWAGLALTG